jgi:broad specificity phosphatase PhoE
MTVLALIRHGPTVWNADKRAQGHTDVPLSDAGRFEVTRWRAPPEIPRRRIFSSPLVRARETAELLLGTPEIEARLIEMSWGDWEGRTIAELRETLGPAMAENENRGFDFRPDAGESPREVLARVQPWIDEVAARGQDATAVTHLGVIRVVMAVAFGWNMLGKPPVKLHRAAAHLFDIAPGTIRVRQMNVSLEPEAT